MRLRVALAGTFPNRKLKREILTEKSNQKIEPTCKKVCACFNMTGKAIKKSGFDGKSLSNIILDVNGR